MEYLKSWHKMPIHHYYKNSEWKRAFIINGLIHVYSISTMDGVSFTLVGNEYIFKEVDLQVIIDYLDALS